MRQKRGKGDLTQQTSFPGFSPTLSYGAGKRNEVGSDGQKWYCCVFLQAYNSETKEFEEAPVEARNAALKGKVGKLINAQKDA